MIFKQFINVIKNITDWGGGGAYTKIYQYAKCDILSAQCPTGVRVRIGPHYPQSPMQSCRSLLFQTHVTDIRNTSGFSRVFR